MGQANLAGLNIIGHYGKASFGKLTACTSQRCSTRTGELGRLLVQLGRLRLRRDSAATISDKVLTILSSCYFARFGAEKGHKAGPDNATTTVGEAVRLKLQAGGLKVSL